jgi:hypothetical protein
MQNDFFMAVVIYIVLAIVIFLIGREIVCWYFKINARLSVLEEIRDLLKVSALKEDNIVPPVLVEKAVQAEPFIKPQEAALPAICPSCRKEITTNTEACNHCNAWLGSGSALKPIPINK